MFRRERVAIPCTALVAVAAMPLSAQQYKVSQATGVADMHVETPARMHGAFFSKDSGTLVINENEVEFRREHCDAKKWAFVDIDTFSITVQKLVIKTFTNQSLHWPGEKSYSFDLDQRVPPTVAASLAKNISRPSRNHIANPKVQKIASIPARHRRPTASTNGVLRFRESGIDYITNSSGDSRSWRWADLRALSEPDPYYLLVFGYRDTYTFQLKKPLSQSLLNQAMDGIYRSSGVEPTLTGGERAQFP